MARITDEDIDLIDKFVSTINLTVDQIKHFSTFMKFQDEDEQVVEEGLKLLLDKIERMKRAKSISKLEKVLKLNKILKNKDGGWL